MTPASGAKYSVIANRLRAKIHGGQLTPGQQIPTEPQLEAEFACSRGTVRRAVQALVQEGILEARRGAGTFVRPQTREKLIAVIVPTVGEPVFSQLIETINHIAREMGYNTLLQTFNENPEGEMAFIDSIAQMNIAGLLRVPTTFAGEQRITNHIRATSLPFALLSDWDISRFGNTHVGMDESSAISMVLDHLTQLRHERIGFCTTENEVHTLTREIFRYQLRSRGLPVDGDSVFSMCGLDHNSTKVFVPDNVDGLTAVVLPHFSAALHFIHGMEQRGTPVPAHCSAVSLGPLAEPKHRVVNITSTIPPFRKIAEQAIWLILEGAKEETAHYYYAPTLHIGETSAPPPAFAAAPKEASVR